ncbi:hypothetical protein QN277_018573 [Acacia crassicarpa]|uniref:AAA+ ATPase domain-containing protein n=1 Tax=Acacia crassicarpa TaxID=499986 RepID=A0AAE1JQU6_9FABA|nr:hypothetical protein QN277_018573 [Acacia crassicarpa]
MEVIVSIGEKISECLAGPILRRARYLFCFKQFVRDVEKAKQELEGKLADMNKRKEEADRKTEEIMPSVKKWLGDVNAIFGDVQKLQQELEERGNKCFNVPLRYSLAKQMEDKAKQMMELKNNSSFEPFSQLIQLPGITYFSSEQFVDFNSRKSAYNRLLEAIKDGKNKMVGLYGMGGSGKTTLAKQVGKKVNELKLFEKVVIVVVSKSPNVHNIQQEIAEQISLKFEETSRLTRAQRLSLGLKNKKILIILDDVWSKLSFEDVGIPLNEGCCVLLTTRLRDVCLDMDCESIIELPILTEEDAWALFNMHANPTTISKNEFDSIGRKIVDECKGLPIAIVTVGSTLKRRGVRVWESTLQKLQRPLPLDVKDDFETLYAILQVSYDNLRSLLAQSLFLLCSMFPEDHEIHIEDLIRFGKGTLKLDDNIYTMEDARKEILITIEKLLDSSLLMHTDKQACVKMHDLVRDVALWVAKKQGQAILVNRDVVSRMLVKNETLKETKAISLWNLENNFKLSNQLYCPTLEILLLHSAGGFFEDLGGIESLKVLAALTFSFQWIHHIWTPIQWSMPQSIVSSLMNLHALCVRGIALGDISFLCQLKILEILDLRSSEFDELPAAIVHMKKLKLLDVFACRIKKSPLEVIEKCEQLDELYFWDGKSVITENFSLSRLKRYAICDSTFASLDPLLMDPPFLKYFDDCIEALRCLCIQGFKVSTLNSSMKDLIFRANCLWLKNCRWDHNDINSEIKHLGVSHCPDKRFIVDNLGTNFPQARQVFSHLITLRLTQMDSLEQVFQDSSIRCSLPKLQELHVAVCPKLTTILTHATVTSIPELRKLQIYSCENVKWLFSYSLTSHCPSLVELRIWDCLELESLIGEEVALGDRLLHDMQDNPCGNEAERAFLVVTAKSFKQLQNHEALMTLFLRLKHVEIKRSGRRMKVMFEVQVRGTLEGEESIEEPLKLNLCSLYLDDLAELEYIWKGPPQSVSLYRLEDVSLSKCPKSKNIFTFAIVTSLPELRTLEVVRCKEWEGIFCEESLKILSSSSNVCFPKLQNISISGSNKVKRLFTYSLAFHCPLLEGITIRDCSELESLVEEASHEDILLGFSN